MAGTAYKIAWKENMGHISLGLAYLPSQGGKDFFLTYFMTEDEKKARTAQNRRDFLEQVWLEGNSTGSFSDEMDVIWNMLKPGRDSMWFSWSNWIESFTFLLTVGMGMYTLFLFLQTTRYVYYQTSIIDQHKRTCYNENIKREARRNRKASESDTDEDADNDTADSNTMKHHP